MKVPILNVRAAIGSDLAPDLELLNSSSSENRRELSSVLGQGAPSFSAAPFRAASLFRRYSRTAFSVSPHIAPVRPAHYETPKKTLVCKIAWELPHSAEATFKLHDVSSTTSKRGLG